MKKRKETEEVETLPPITAMPVAQVVTSTGLRVDDHVEMAPKRTRIASSAVNAPAFGKLKAVAKEFRLEDERYVHRVAEMLKSAGFERMVQLQGSSKENKVKAFNSVLRGLHNLFLVDSLKEHVTLME